MAENVWVAQASDVVNKRRDKTDGFQVGECLHESDPQDCNGKQDKRVTCRPLPEYQGERTDMCAVGLARPG